MLEGDQLDEALTLLNAARWTRTHDPSPGFLGELRRIVGLLGVEMSDADL